MDDADSSDSDRSVNRLCSFSTTFRCVVGSSSFSTAMGGEVSCGKEQRFKRSEQVAATRRLSVLLPQSTLRYTRQFWTVFLFCQIVILYTGPAIHVASPEPGAGDLQSV